MSQEPYGTMHQLMMRTPWNVGLWEMRMANFFSFSMVFLAGFALGFAAGRRTDQTGYERGYKAALAETGKQKAGGLSA